ncbi:unnamed protein product [marine sediment metagenome]|uniref:Uncharacterized protein n=1 Tax=marine sediment metagenome TaxID=412755 RepID=X1CFF3_9ZZZZ
MRFRASIVHPFYPNDVFIRKQEHIDGFILRQQLRGLKDVDIIVDTMTILSHPPLDLYKMEDERKKKKTTPGLFPATSPADRSDDQ